MKKILSKEDKIKIIKGLKSNEYPIHKLNHLSKDIQDFSGFVDLFDGYSLPITAGDKKELLKALQRGFIDFEKISDLHAEMTINPFIKLMMEATATEL